MLLIACIALALIMWVVAMCCLGRIQESAEGIELALVEILQDHRSLKAEEYSCNTSCQQTILDFGVDAPRKDEK